MFFLISQGKLKSSFSDAYIVIYRFFITIFILGMFMASGPITSRQIEGEKVEAVTDFIFLGSKVTVDGD